MTLNAFCKTEVGCKLEGGLIQNQEPVTYAQALMFNKEFVLRWRYRRCKYCDDEFDIESQGFGYNCGCC